MRFAAGAVSLVLLAFAVHHDALDGWWLSDDPQLVLHAMMTRPSEVLTEPSSYRYLSTSSFTPLVTISFDTDLELAGVRPTFFYWHQLLALIVAAVLLFALLARVRGRYSLAAAWIAAAGFVISPAAVHAARSLMIRHYVEGLVFALAALLLWDLLCGGARRTALLLGGSTACYLLAILSKEVYAPLPLLMIWIAYARGVQWRRLLLWTSPMAIVAAAYIPWRIYMLGTVGGYREGSPLRSILFVLPRMGSTILGPLPPWIYGIAGLFAGLLFFVAVAERRRLALGFAALTILFALIPLSGLAADYDLRYAFAATVLLFAALGLAANAGRRELLIPLAAVALVGGAGGWFGERNEERSARSTVAEGQYVWSAPANAPPILGSAPGWYFAGIEEVRARSKHGRAPRWLLSHEGFILGGLPPERAVRSVPGGSGLRSLSAEERAAIDVENSRFTPDGAMDVRIEMINNEMRWQLGPEGAFAYLTVPQYAKFPMPASGVRRLPEANRRQQFRIRRELPYGRWTVSAVLTMPFPEGSVRWSRAGDARELGNNR